MIQLPLDMNEYPCSQIRSLFGTLVKCKLKSKRTVTKLIHNPKIVSCFILFLKMAHKTGNSWTASVLIVQLLKIVLMSMGFWKPYFHKCPIKLLNQSGLTQPGNSEKFYNLRLLFGRFPHSSWQSVQFSKEYSISGRFNFDAIITINSSQE